MKKIKLKDWQIRALKTFVQAFFGVLIPEACSIIAQGSLLEGWSVFAKLMAPFIGAALAAGISAAWNVIAAYLKKQEETYADTED